MPLDVGDGDEMGGALPGRDRAVEHDPGQPGLLQVGADHHEIGSGRAEPGLDRLFEGPLVEVDLAGHQERHVVASRPSGDELQVDAGVAKVALGLADEPHGGLVIGQPKQTQAQPRGRTRGSRTGPIRGGDELVGEQPPDVNPRRDFLLRLGLGRRGGGRRRRRGSRAATAARAAPAASARQTAPLKRRGAPGAPRLPARGGRRWSRRR